CKQAVKASPSSAACLDSLGWVYFKLGLYDDAKKYLNQALELDENNKIIKEHLHLLEGTEWK
nr:tetratricopeptide repeat protein [Treponema sp.]